MTSQINPNNIDGSYPVAGQDNDSQGFRDNFTNIRNNFTFTKAELEDLQNKVVLKSALLNTTLSNDFAGNTLVNPAFTSWRETYNDIGSASGPVTVNFVNGNFQKLTMSGSTTLTFSFPANTSGQFASIKLWIANTNSAWTLTLPSSVSLNGPLSIGGAAGSPVTITFTADEIANNTNYLFEFYTINGGTTVGIIDHTRNRDISLTALAVSGSFSANGTVTLGAASSNVVVAATTASTSTTTGALVVTGGVGISGSLYADGNLWINSGNIRTSGTTGNVFNISAATVSLGNAATNIFMGASTGNVTVGGNVIAGANSRAASFVPTSTSIPSHGIYDGGSGTIGFSTNFTPNWLINASGTFLPQADNTFDIGNGTVNPRDITASRILLAKGNVVAASGTASTNTTTGALVVVGGAGISGAITAGGNVVAASGTASTDTSTGALVVVGGAGVSGAINTGSTITASGNIVAASGTASTNTTTGALVVVGGVGVSGVITSGGNVVAASGTASTNTTTGALVVAGGVGVSGAINTGSTITASGNIVAASGTASTNTTTGALVVVGGVGVSGAINTGSTITASGNVVAAAGTTSVSTTTGALVVTGGVGVSGNLFLPASSTSIVPINFGVGATGGNITGVQQGALEANLGIGATGTASNVMIFAPTNATSSGEALVPVAHYTVLGSNVAVNNGTAPALSTPYSMFGGPVALNALIGNVMLAAGTTYEFDVHSMVSMAAAPTASTIGFTFTGNATTTYFSYGVQSYPVSGTGGLNQGNTSHWYGTTTFPATSSVVLNTQAYTNFAIRARGLIRINAQGTILPLLQWNTAPTQIATAVQGSYIKFTPLGTQANIVIGTVMGTPFLP